MSGNVLWYNHPAANFNEALPLGNGRIGAMVYGGIIQERLSLNEDTMWSGYPRVPEQAGADVFQQARELVLAGRMSEAQRLIENGFGDFLVQMYLPLGNLTLTLGHGDGIENYRRVLDLTSAVHTVRYTCDGKVYTRETFISHPMQLLAMRITCDKPASVTFTAALAGRLPCSSAIENGRMFIEGHAPVCRAPYGQTHNTPEAKIYSDCDTEKGVGYRAGMAVCAVGGTVQAEADGIAVTDADEAVIYFAVRTSFNGAFRHPITEGAEYRHLCVCDLEKAAFAGFDEMRREHITDYQRLYDRVSLYLGDSPNAELPTDERLKKHAAGERDNALYALLFNYGRYLTIAASRQGTQAMNLQGIWNEELIPPWSCNYTLNINTEMNYWPTLACGLAECYEPLIKMVKELATAGERTARDAYGAPGWVSHHATDLWRVTHPSTNRLPGSTQWGFWNLSSGWLTVMLFDYYTYTKELDYLRSIYPVIEGCAAFYRRLLIEYDGEYILAPSTSPENNYLTKDGYTPLDKTTAMTMQIVREGFEVAVNAADILGENAEEYASLLPRLRGPQIRTDGALNEWYGEHPDWDPHHRHISHLYALFPSRQINRSTPELLAACKKTLERRGDSGTGWSLAWKVNLWAQLGDGNRALRLLDTLLHPVESSNVGHNSGGGSYLNLLCAHPPFQIDGNLGACSGILQMLLQCDGDEVALLPALPETWQDGEVKGLALPGGSCIDFTWRHGKLTEYILHGQTNYRIIDLSISLPENQ